MLRRWWVVAPVTLFALLLTTVLVAPLSTRERHGQFTFSGQTRSYLVHMPASYSGKRPVPLVIVLHGAPSDGPGVAHESGFSAVADREGFLAVYPDGGPVSPAGPRARRGGRYGWDSGGMGRLVPPREDVKYLRALIQRLRQEYRIDPKRIYAAGMSNGGMMTHRLGAEAGDLLAAIAPVAGTLNVPLPSGPPLPVIMVHGRRDQMVAYQGRWIAREWRIAAVPDSVRAWVTHNGCAPKPARTREGNVTIERYAGRTPRADVVLYTVEDGKHEWPRRAPHARTGFDATEAVWQFFRAHAKP